MIEALIAVINITIAVLILMGIGAYLAHKKLVVPAVSDFLAKLVTRVALPGLIIVNFNQYFTREELWRSLSNVYLPLIAMTIGLVMGAVMSRLAGVQKDRRGVFSAMVAFSNTVFLGIPICTALFGEQVVPIALYYYLGNTLLFWTVGVWCIARDRGQKDVPLGQRIRRLFPPPIIAVIFCCLQIQFGLKLPTSFMTAMQYLGSLCTPLSLLFIGSTLYTAFSGGVKWIRGTGWVLVGRLLLAPVICFGLTVLFKVEATMAQVFVIQASMPVMSQTPMVARTYGADDTFAATATALSTLLCMGMLPLIRVAQVWLYGAG